MQKKWILFFIIYTLSAFMIFTYILFPTQMLEKKIKRTLSQNFPGEVLIKDISFKLPANLKMKRLELTFSNESKGNKPLSINIDEIKAAPDFYKILKGKLGIRGELLIGDGIVKADIDQNLFGSPVRYLTGSIKNISIQDFPFLSQQLGMHVTGLLEGEIEAEWPNKDILKSDGTWSFDIEGGRVIPKQFPAFSFETIHGKGLIKEENIHINRIEIQGEDLSLTATGKVKLAQQIKDFFVDTQVGLKVLPRLRQRLGGFANLLPKPDNSGFINIFLSGPPGELRFSSQKRKN
ncbi:MAG: type II secretion system protein GspN [bacterium]